MKTETITLYSYEELDEKAKEKVVQELYEKCQENSYDMFKYNLYKHLYNNFNNVKLEYQEYYDIPILMTRTITSEQLYKIYNIFECVDFGNHNDFHICQPPLNKVQFDNISVEFKITKPDGYLIYNVISEVINCDDIKLRRNIQNGVNQYLSEINILLKNTLPHIQYHCSEYYNPFWVKLNLEDTNLKLFENHIEKKTERFSKEGCIA